MLSASRPYSLKASSLDWRGQGLVDEADARRGVALEDVGVEAVEAADGRHDQVAALGRIRVDIGEVGEVGGIGRIAVHGDAVRRLRRLHQRRRRKQRPGQNAGDHVPIVRIG